MNKNEIMSSMTKAVGKVKFSAKKYSPEILVVAGVIGTVASAVLACRATLKVNDILEETKKNVETVHSCSENEEMAEQYSKEDAQKDLVLIYAQTAIQFGKLYAPSVALGAISIVSILASNNILKKRNAALAAAYMTVDKSFKEYRSRVVDRFGTEVDRELRHCIKAKELEETTVNEKTGKEKKTTKTIQVAESNDESDYSRFFDEASYYWDKDAGYNLAFLNAQQNYANDKLKAQGYLFLNDVYRMLGIQETKAGQVVGWVYNPENPIGDNCVDFGIYDTNRAKTKDFVDGYERSILLDFNVDGYILDKCW